MNAKFLSNLSFFVPIGYPTGMQNNFVLEGS